MAKRKENPSSQTNSDSDSQSSSQSNSDSSIEDGETVDVDFEFFDPIESDFHGIKSLVSQTLGTDAEYLAVSDIADAIVKQSAYVGTCVKMGAGEEEDPYALMTCLSFKKTSLIAFKTYLLERTLSHQHNKKLEDALNSNTCWLLNERLINMPPQIVVPMFNLITEELGWAVEDKEDYDFDYFVVVSKIYNQIDSTEADSDQETPKPKKRQKKQQQTECFFFQPEDEVILKHAEFTLDYKLKNKTSVSDSKRVFQEFGVEPFRRLMVIPKANFKAMVAGVKMFIE